jgi:hypothetical protein
MEKLDKWDNDDNKNDNDDSKINNELKQKQLADRYNVDFNRQAEIGLIDRQLATLGRNGGIIYHYYEFIRLIN